MKEGIKVKLVKNYWGVSYATIVSFIIVQLYTRLRHNQASGFVTNFADWSQRIDFDFLCLCNTSNGV